jgi:hypothetical protein
MYVYIDFSLLNIASGNSFFWWVWGDAFLLAVVMLFLLRLAEEKLHGQRRKFIVPHQFKGTAFFNMKYSF